MPEKTPKAYVIAVDMGYGHQRAAFSLLKIADTPDEWNLAEPIIISANNYPGMPDSDKTKWHATQKAYEWISRFNGFPVFGKTIFHLMDYLQKIKPFYPKRDLSKSNFETRQVHKMIKHGLGKHLIETLNKKPLPMICTFPVPALFAEAHGYQGDIYCLCTDTDAARAWAPLHPETSRITYLAPTVRAKERLKLYGIRPEKIVVTGFPVPEMGAMCPSLERRIAKLDPEGIFRKKYKKLISFYIGTGKKVAPENAPLTITFCVGGAGAQTDIGVAVMKSLREHIEKGEVKLNLVAGASQKILTIFEESLKKLGLDAYRDRGVSIVYMPNKYEYFAEFNKILNETDILWTKPSELSFYVGLGIPIIMTPPLGSQEEYNKVWLHMVGAGLEQYDPKYANEWLFDWLKSGWLAQAAVNGFLNAPKKAVGSIANIALYQKKIEMEDIHLI